METIICLIRHGQTDWNKKYLIQGTINNPLNETGKKQANDTANLLKEISNIDGEIDGAYNIRKNGEGIERKITENTNKT